MPPANPRIIVVDDNKGVFNIVRASLELLGRRPRLIEAYTADDALLEIRLGSPDLLVSAHSLPGTTNGLLLALMAKRELAALPIIIMADEHDPEVDEDTLAQSPFQYFRRPIMPEAFIRALRIALDGPESVPQETKSEDMMLPVPPLDEDKLRPILFKLMRDVGAMAIVLADRNGKVKAFEGAAGYIDRDLLSASLGPGFGSTTKMLSIIGEQPRVLKYYDGDKIDVFALAIGLHYFIVLVFDNKAGSTLGNVKRFGGNAVNEMIAMVGTEIAFATKPKPVAAPTQPAQEATPAPTPTKTTKVDTGHHKKVRRTQEVAGIDTSRQNLPVAEPEMPKAMQPIVNFDMSLLDGLDKIDLDAAEDLFSPEKMASQATTSGNKISFADARQQGIVGDVDE